MPKKRKWKQLKLFILAKKFKKVRSEHRLEFLKSHLKLDKPNISLKLLHKKRLRFDKIKDNAFRIWTRKEHSACYVCNGRAKIRHHVVPLIKGGANDPNNIVPLCHPCHVKVHPHMYYESVKESCRKEATELGIPFEQLWEKSDTVLSDSKKFSEDCKTAIVPVGNKRTPTTFDGMVKLIKVRPLCKPRQKIVTIPPKKAIA